MFTVYRLLLDARIQCCFNQIEMLAIMTAALAHDVGHPGVNNVYLVKAKHSFALCHNDRSPLENMHCAVLYDILMKQETNILASLKEDQWRDVRTVMLTAILGTDMSHHFEQISKTQLFLEMNKDDIHNYCAGNKETITVFEQPKERLFILELCLHCADVSNPYKPFALCEKWAYLVVEEFGQQADREKAEGLEVSPMMDRDTINLYNMQMGFIEFVVSPLLISVVNIFYPLHPIGQQMLTNYLAWGNKRKEEISKDKNIASKEEEIEKLDKRMANFKTKFAFLEILEAKPLRTNKTRAQHFIRKSVSSSSSSTTNGGSLSPMNKSKKVTSFGSPTITPRAKKILGKE